MYAHTWKSRKLRPGDRWGQLWGTHGKSSYLEKLRFRYWVAYWLIRDGTPSCWKYNCASVIKGIFWQAQQFMFRKESKGQQRLHLSVVALRRKVQWTSRQLHHTKCKGKSMLEIRFHHTVCITSDHRYEFLVLFTPSRINCASSVNMLYLWSGACN